MHERLLQLWGKTASGDEYHPAIFHMLDVGHVASALLSDAATPRIRNAMQYAWRGADTDDLIAWLPFIVALHDIGKIAAPFQGQQTNGATKRQHERLLRVGFPLPENKPAKSIPHNAISAVFLDTWLSQREGTVHRTTHATLRDAIGGHHGFFVNDLHEVTGNLLLSNEAAEWNELRRAGYDLLRTTFAPITGSLADVGRPRAPRSATIALTGLMVLADWIGSNTHYFPANCQAAFDAYVTESQQRALAAIKDVGFANNRAAPTYTNVSALFPDIKNQPRPLQAAIDALPAADLRGPALYVIEAPTGEGKTEAALALARRLAAGGAGDELFFALPTMATNNQMFGRLSTFYDRLYGESGAVKLIHGQATLLEDELRRLALIEPNNDSDATTVHWAASGAQMLDWFGSSKRALLAPFGAGTVDQVELAGLHTRYYMLKLFSLAGKIVVIDEVHAYDTYMNTILYHTLQWMAALGTSVILLSATLPAQRHAALATAFMQGVSGDDTRHIDTPPDLDYPLVSIYTEHGQRRMAVEAFRPQQHLTLEFVHDEGCDAQAQRLLDLVANGGAVARLCNRVADAQGIFAALQRLDPPSCVLIHARFPLEERKELEYQINDLVGRNTARTATDRVIIVGTQVLEQSLDYDVDVMVSDLAPIDLLLQRAGRLHRHQRERLPHFRDAVMYVQFPLAANDLPDWKRWQRIYDEYILWRSWEVLQKRAANGIILIMLPNDYRPLIEAVYTADLPPSDAPYVGAMHKAWDTMQKAQINMDGEAKLRLTPHPLRRDGITRGDELQFIEDEDGALTGWEAAKTRLGDRITVIPLYKIDGKLSLDPHGQQTLPKQPPTLDQQKALLNRALPLSDAGLIKALRQDNQWPWRKAPALLKHVYPLELGANGTTTLAGMQIRLDSLLGLTLNEENHD